MGPYLIGHGPTLDQMRRGKSGEEIPMSMREG